MKTKPRRKASKTPKPVAAPRSSSFEFIHEAVVIEGMFVTKEQHATLVKRAVDAERSSDTFLERLSECNRLAQQERNHHAGEMKSADHRYSLARSALAQTQAQIVCLKESINQLSGASRMLSEAVRPVTIDGGVYTPPGVGGSGDPMFAARSERHPLGGEASVARP